MSVTSTSRWRARPMHTPPIFLPSRARSSGLRTTFAPSCRPHAEQLRQSSAMVRPQKLQYIKPPVAKMTSRKHDSHSLEETQLIPKKFPDTKLTTQRRNRRREEHRLYPCDPAP